MCDLAHRLDRLERLPKRFVFQVRHRLVTGSTTASYTVDCSNPSVTSLDGQYNTSYCTHAYVWELTQVNADGGCDGRKLNVYVSPATIPTDQTDCEATSATFYLYGLTATNEYIYTTNVQSKACTWSGTFGCSCNANISDVDLDNWPTDPDGGTTSVDGLRIVGQVYNSNLGNYVKLTESLSEYELSPCCIHAPSP